MSVQSSDQGSIVNQPALPPAKPVQVGGPAADWPYRALYQRVLAALYALPDRFETSLKIEGVPVTDLFTMNSALGAAIEKSVVDSLNDLRNFWDPQHEFADYRFIRQSQCFPDVLLKSNNPDTAHPEILMGIELKGWFVLSKEGEPSFRYKIAPHCCSEADLLVVMPWLFDSVISGKPKLLAPIIAEARWAAEMRNHHWEWLRGNPNNEPPERRGVTPATHQGYYPSKSDRSADTPISDSGSNFGRVARCGAIDSEVEERLQEDALGIPVDAWRRFLQVFADRATPQAISNGLNGIERAFVSPLSSAEQRRQASALLSQLSGLLND
jgi:hypothetical protein